MAWNDEPIRHGLSSKGVRTGRKKLPLKMGRAGARFSEYPFPEITDKEIDKQLYSVAVAAGLSGEQLWRFTYFMMKSGFYKSTPDYQAEWAGRFKKGNEYLMSDARCSKILADYDKLPVKQKRKGKFVRAHRGDGFYFWDKVK
jgi:hypothetical protein